MTERKQPKKRTPAQKRAAKRAAPREPVVPTESELRVPKWTGPKEGDPRSTSFTRPSRSPIRELTEDEQFELPKLPDAATHDQLLVALAAMDPLEQEVLIAQRLAAMPSQKDGGMPVNVPRQVRAPWARQLRKLGFFCVPELATHELVADPGGGGLMANHTAARMQKLTMDDFWEMAKQQSPGLGPLVDQADTPEKRKEAMSALAKNLPVEMRIAFERLLSHHPDDLAPH